MEWTCNSAHIKTSSQHLCKCVNLNCVAVSQSQGSKICSLICLTDMFCYSTLAGFSSTDIWGGESTVALSPLGYHENTISKNRGLLFSFQPALPGILSLQFAWLDGGNTHRSSISLVHINDLQPTKKCFWLFLSSIAERLQCRLVKSAQG